MGTETNERITRTTNELDDSLARERVHEACDVAGHVETKARLHLDMRKTEALWLMTSKSIARVLDFDAKVVNPERNETSGCPTGVNNEESARS